MPVAPLDADRPAPYLTVVLNAPRAGEPCDGGEPLDRLELFVRCFDAQCRQAALDAEVIVVDWNRPAHVAGVAARLRLPEPGFCTYRFIDVPSEEHRRHRHADVLHTFPMIAKNVGLRRARGRFVLVTSADVLFPTELIAYLASRPLQPGRLYRADRRDVEPEVPREAPLEAKMAYCATHQLRVHARWGTYAVDHLGITIALEEDIVEGGAVRLGAGWHVREGDRRAGYFRWAADRAEVIIEAPRDAVGGQVLQLDVEANPHDPRAWVTLEARRGDRVLSRTHVTARMHVVVPLEHPGHDGPFRVELRVTDTQERPRLRLPVFERRDQLAYRVYSARIRPTAPRGSIIEYPLSGWTNANPSSHQTVTTTADGALVATDPLKWSYSMHYGPLQAPAGGTYQFDLSCAVLEGRVLVGVLNGARDGWVSASISVEQEPNETRFGISVDLNRHEPFWLMLYNDHPDGVGVSRFIVRGLTGSIAPDRLAVSGASARRAKAWIGRAATIAGRSTARIRQAINAVLLPDRRRGRSLMAADAGAGAIATGLSESARVRLVRTSPEYRALERAFHIADEQARTLAPLQELSSLHDALRRHRGDNLHVNACGDFQLMAREDWYHLRGYPELDAFPQHVDSLLAFVAGASEIAEEVLPMAIYHLEPAVSTDPASDEDVILKRRMAERNVPALDEATVSIWAFHMRWLKRPFLFNGADWGLDGLALPEHTVMSTIEPAS